MKKSLFIFVLAFMFSTSAIAAPFTPPSIDYSADSIITTGGMSINTKINYTPQKQRTEMNVGGMSQIVIVRQDKKEAWVLMPQMKKYMQMSVDQVKEMTKSPTDAIMEQTAIGDEVLNGVQTTKYKVVFNQQGGVTMDGLLWITKEGIPLKTQSSVSSGDTKTDVSTELKNIKIEKQDPALFEIPAGYTLFSMPANMGSAAPGQPPMGQ